MYDLSSDNEKNEPTDVEDIPQPDNNDVEGEESDCSFIDIRVAKRMAIAYLFVHDFNATEDENQWPVIAKVIKEKLSISRYYQEITNFLVDFFINLKVSPHRFI